MEEKNKRKICKAKTLQLTKAQKKITVGAFVQVNAERIRKAEIKKTKNSENEILTENKPKTNIVGQFQLVVIKLPWYKKIYRSFLGFLGLYYN